MRAPYGPKVWASPIVYLIALLGTWFVSKRERPVLGCFASHCLRRNDGGAMGSPKLDTAFPSDATTPTGVNHSRLFYLPGVTIAVLLVLAAPILRRNWRP